ncbi:MAG TPA: hypothetical protein VG711_09920, partial [Phycisphaerales bacterium]|nr:hypothetical protein [Phycisphaerales bacterium]
MIKQMVLATSVALGFAVLPASAVTQTYNGTGGVIADATTSNSAPGSTNYIINIADAGTINAVLNVVMTFSNTHTWCGDLEVTLIAPNLDDVHLFSRLGLTASTGFGDSSDL